MLGSFAAPALGPRDDVEPFAERIQATATSILTLLDMDADPLTSPAHILIANILQHTWQAGASLDLAGLIGAIQNPPMDRIGVMDLEAVYPAKDRFALAMKLYNVLASPGFPPGPGACRCPRTSSIHLYPHAVKSVVFSHPRPIAAARAWLEAPQARCDEWHRARTHTLRLSPVNRTAHLW